MVKVTVTQVRNAAAAAGFAALAACATPPPPPPPPPPPVAIPSRPQPPGGAPVNFVVPPRDMYGIRQTVNTGVSGVQKSWNLRSAFTVAALNCLQSKYAGILPAYKTFLETQKAGLARINRSVEHEWREKVGSGYKRARDTYSTKVYNYFALPPALPRFCDAMNQVALESQTVTPTDLDVFSQASLDRIEGVFEQYFRDFEQYRVAAAEWDAKYGAMYGTRRAVPVSANYSSSYASPVVSGQPYGQTGQDGDAYPSPDYGSTP